MFYINSILNPIFQHFQSEATTLSAMIPHIRFRFSNPPADWPTHCLPHMGSESSGCMIGMAAQGVDFPRDKQWNLTNVHSNDEFEVSTQSDVGESEIGEMSIYKMEKDTDAED